MKARFKFAAALLLLCVECARFSGFAQGSLTPPGPPGPTMVTLSQIQPRTPISSLPFVITNAGSYYLTTNLAGTNINGIIINTNNVTLDLSGFTLQGSGSGFYGGVVVGHSYTNITVRNGTLCGWPRAGLDAWDYDYPRNMVFEHLTVSANGGYGIFTEAQSVIRDCLSFSNASDGIFSEGGIILNCESRENGGNGITIVNGSVRDCLSVQNGSHGIFVQGNGCQIVNNVCQFNRTNGIYVIPGNCYVANNICDANKNDGIDIAGSNNRIDSNQVTGNTQYGIETAVATTYNVIIRNTIMNNAGAYIDRGANDFGPLGSAATATSPWANISH